jgi:gamma-glutamyltranspeptidase/glutathione hydrolase
MSPPRKNGQGFSSATRWSRAASALSALGGGALLVLGFPIACASIPNANSPRSLAPAEVASSVAQPGEVEVTSSGHEDEQRPAEPKEDPIAVACENGSAAAAAMAVLRRGGHAADAAVAAVLAAGVAQPVSSGLGGGGFALVWDAATKRASVLDFRETAPLGLRANEHVARGTLETRPGVFVGVPGEPAGLAELHRRWGKLGFSEVVRPAEELAEHGFVVSPHLSRALGWNLKWLRRTPQLAALLHDGEAAPPGTTARNAPLAATLRRFASEGPGIFYDGALAEDIVQTARAGGSRMVAADLAQYRVVERAPLTTAWEGYEVVTMPPPSAGGVMLLETLRMHPKRELEALGIGTGAYLHILAETFRGAVADRMRFVGDPAFVKVDVEALTASDRMRARRAKIRLDKTTRAERFPLREEGTSHLVVVDRQGNVVSLTSTINGMFGAQLITKGGYPLNNELADFTLAPMAKRFGVLRDPNAPRGGARPVSSMTPTLILKDGAPVLALGGSGGPRIATATSQVALAYLAFGQAPAAAIAAPRIETPAAGGLLVDPTLDEDVVRDLERRGEVVIQKPSFSAVQVVAITQTTPRQLQAGADARKGGVALVE